MWLKRSLVVFEVVERYCSQKGSFCFDGVLETRICVCVRVSGKSGRVGMAFVFYSFHC